MKLGRIRPAPRKPAPKKLAPVKPALKKPTPVRPTPSPGLPRSPDRGNVEQNYRGIPGLVNATAPILRGRPNPGVGMPPSSPPSGGATGSTGFKSAFGGIDSNMLAPSGGATGNPTGVKLPPGGLARPVFQGMKKGGEVKASKATKASSASKRADGIATKGKTKGRFV